MTNLEADPAARAYRPDTLAVRGGLMRSSFEETVEALYAYACALEDAYPGCNPRVDLSDLIERAVRDHRLNALVAVLETPE